MASGIFPKLTRLRSVAAVSYTHLDVYKRQALFFFTIENKFASLCCRLVVVNTIWIGQRKRHCTAAVLVDCHFMDIKRIAVAIDGQINFLNCALQACLLYTSRCV